MPWTLRITGPAAPLPPAETFPTWQAAADVAEKVMTDLYESPTRGITAKQLGAADVALMEAMGRIAVAESDGEQVSIHMGGYAFHFERVQFRGAPMGRPGGTKPATDDRERFTLQRVRLNSGGYDSGGAYWGHGQPLFWYEGPGPGEDGHLRASDREAAKAAVRKLHPAARFYR